MIHRNTKINKSIGTSIFFAPSMVDLHIPLFLIIDGASRGSHSLSVCVGIFKDFRGSFIRDFSKNIDVFNSLYVW